MKTGDGTRTKTYMYLEPEPNPPFTKILTETGIDKNHKVFSPWYKHTLLLTNNFNVGYFNIIVFLVHIFKLRNKQLHL